MGGGIEGLTCDRFLADRAFDADWLSDALNAVRIEAFSGNSGNTGGIAMRCCKTDDSDSAFIAIAETVIRLR